MLTISSTLFIGTAFWFLFRSKKSKFGIDEAVEFGKRNKMEYLGDFNPTILLDGISEKSRQKVSTFLTGAEFRMYHLLHHFRGLEFFKRGQKKRLRHILFRRDTNVEKAIFLYSYMNVKHGLKFRVRYYAVLFRNLEISFKSNLPTHRELKCQADENNILIYFPATSPCLAQLEWFENKSSEYYRFLVSNASAPVEEKKKYRIQNTVSNFDLLN